MFTQYSTQKRPHAAYAADGQTSPEAVKSAVVKNLIKNLTENLFYVCIETKKTQIEEKKATASSVDVQGVNCLQCGRAGCTIIMYISSPLCSKVFLKVVTNEKGGAVGEVVTIIC